jgi:hypothetical protein
LVRLKKKCRVCENNCKQFATGTSTENATDLKKQGKNPKEGEFAINNSGSVPHLKQTLKKGHSSRKQMPKVSDGNIDRKRNTLEKQRAEFAKTPAKA